VLIVYGGALVVLNMLVTVLLTSPKAEIRSIDRLDCLVGLSPILVLGQFKVHPAASPEVVTGRTP